MKKKFIFSLMIVILISFIFIFTDKIDNKKNFNDKEVDKNISISSLANNIFGFQAISAAGEDKIIFKWTENRKDVSYYKLYHGVVSGVYGESIKTNGKVATLAVDVSKFNTFEHFFALSAVDAYGNESDYSKELAINLNPDFVGTTNPAIASCGNGILQIDEGEICDGGYKIFPEFFSTNIYRGVKKCKSNCLGWENTPIIIEKCGDGLINGLEECDYNAKVDSFIYCQSSGKLGKKFCGQDCKFGDCEVPPQTGL